MHRLHPIHHLHVYLLPNTSSVRDLMDGLAMGAFQGECLSHIIGTSTLEGEGFCAGDVNGDGVINVTDIVSLINIILS